MADVFISYSRSDRPVAERLAAALEAQGVSVWMDNQITSGSTFTDVTEKALNEARKVVVLWSKTSIQSSWVRDEAQIGKEQGKLATFSIDGAIPPIGFRQFQSVDIADWAKAKGAQLPAVVLQGLGLDGSDSDDDRPTEDPKRP